MHKESEECEINYTGSSGAMESATAIFFFLQRSMEKLYNSMLGNRDVKTTGDHLTDLD